MVNIVDEKKISPFSLHNIFYFNQNYQVKMDDFVYFNKFWLHRYYEILKSNTYSFFKWSAFLNLWNNQNYDFYLSSISLDIKPGELKLNHQPPFYL